MYGYSTDFSGSMNFLLLAFLTLFLGNEANYTARNVLASVFVILWAIRLGGFLLFRVLKTGKDGEFPAPAHFRSRRSAHAELEGLTERLPPTLARHREV